MIRNICYQHPDIQDTLTRSKATIETSEIVVKYV